MRLLALLALALASIAPDPTGRRVQEGDGSPRPSLAPAAAGAEPPTGPDESLAPLLAALAARDERLRHVSFAFKVEFVHAIDDLPTLWCEGRLDHSDHRRRLELKSRNGRFEETLTWNGARFAHAMRDWENAGQCRFEIGTDPGTKFCAAFYPCDIGTHLNDQPLGKALAAVPNAWDGGRVDYGGSSLREVFLGARWPAADGSFERRPWQRLLVDDRKTLLVMRNEVLVPEASGEALPSAPAVSFRGDPFRVMSSTTVRAAAQVGEIWFATVAELDHPGTETDGISSFRVTLDPAACSIEAPTEPDRYELQNVDRYPVLDLETGLLQEVDAPGAMVGQIDQMARDLALELGRPVSSGLEPDATRWRTPSCGALAAYLLLRLEGQKAELDPIIDAIGAEGSATSIAEISKCLERGGVPVAALASNWSGLAQLEGPFVVHLQRLEDGSDGHFTLATMRERRLRLHDPRATFDAEEEWFETVAGGEVAVIVPRRAVPERVGGGSLEVVILASAGGLCIAAAVLARRRQGFGASRPHGSSVSRPGGAAALILALAPSCIESPAADSPAWVVVGDASVDAGTVDPRQPLIRSFRLRNTSAKPIALDAITKSCGCSEVVVTPPVVPPHGESAVRVAVDMSGQWRRDVTIRLASSERDDLPPLYLRVRASSRTANELSVRPRVLDFGEVAVGSAAVRQFEVTSRGSVESFAALRIEAPAWVEVVTSAPRSVEREPSGACVRTWRVTASVLAGFAIEPRREGQLVLTLDDGSAARVAVTTAMATVGDFRARPSRFFATAQGQGRLSRSIALERGGSSAAVLTGVRCDVAGVTVALDAPPSSGLAVEVDPARLPGESIVLGTIRVDWTGGATDGLDIPLAVVR